MRFNWCNADKIHPAPTNKVEIKIQARTDRDGRSGNLFGQAAGVSAKPQFLASRIFTISSDRLPLDDRKKIRLRRAGGRVLVRINVDYV